MNVTKGNLDEATREFESLVASASFVAVDLEMSGIHLPDCKECLLDTPSLRYGKMRRVASRFNMVQVGLTLFHGTTARTYNVFTFPAKGLITLDGSAVEFLVKNGMDWNAWFRDGVPYLRTGAAEKLRQKMFPDVAVPTVSPKGSVMVLDKTEDIQFCKDVLQGVADWAKQPDEEHVLPLCNSYRRRFLYQELERIYTEFSIETRTPDPNRHWEKVMVVMHLTPAQRDAKAASALAQKNATYDEKLGFRRIWTALTRAGRPLVVHNGLFDLLFLVAHLHEDLPDTLDEFKIVLGGLFPGGVFDTRTIGGKVFVPVHVPVDKAVASEDKKEDAAATTPSKRAMFPNLRLDQLYGVCKSESDAAIAAAAASDATETMEVDKSANEDDKPVPANVATTTQPRIQLAVQFAKGHERYEDPSKAILHEAGYDSYITAFSFAYMRRMTEQQETDTTDTDTTMTSVAHLADSKYRMPLYRSLYPGVNLTPHSHDAVLEMEGDQQHVFKGFPKEYQTSDVMRLFTTTPVTKEEGTSDKELTPLSVFVRWINDEFVVVRFANDDAERAMANLQAHINSNAATDGGGEDGQANHNMCLVTLDAYMRAADEELAATVAPEGTVTKDGVKRAAESATLSVDGSASPSAKKAKIEKY